MIFCTNSFGDVYCDKDIYRVLQPAMDEVVWQFYIVFKNTDMMKQESDMERINRLIHPSLEKIYASRASVNKFGQSTALVIRLINTFVQNLMFFNFIEDFDVSY
ncbi:hypothetical protein [Virgibacillus dokdonensis]|uniref:Uncharacterized protein n=1 Tax=Virgibacillus dokdonensis TaxID=302167 RepID=A0A2K9IW90_9BACI|nr:hypothetical protein [Virgibacillus dokdonensis]AUJ23705.1 hypothetical protein A21D_00592 [Virgibacillus dokdonensis]